MIRGGDFHALVTAHFGPRVGDNFPLSLPPLVETFLQQQLNKPKLVLRQIIQYCNMATGYPVWYLAYESGEPPEARKLPASAATTPRKAAKHKPAFMTTGKARKQRQPAQAKAS